MEKASKFTSDGVRIMFRRVRLKEQKSGKRLNAKLEYEGVS
ncbi:MAG: hypothetical protein QW566_02495 [Candidatus Jordarchaeales archaeon]